MGESQEDPTNIRNGCSRKSCWKYIVHNVLLFSSLAAVTLGIALGMFIKTFHLSEVDKLYIAFPGELLTRMLQLMTIPLIVTNCVMMGVSGLSADTSRKIVVRATVYFVSTSLLSVTIGLILVLLVKPGAPYIFPHHEPEDEERLSIIFDLLDLVRNMMPKNLIQAGSQQYKTSVLEFEDLENLDTNSSLTTKATQTQVVGRYVDGANTLDLIVCSYVFGLTLKKMGERGKILLNIFRILNETTKYVVKLILWYLPLGVLFMTASHVVDAQNWNIIFKLGKFMAVVVIGLLIHGLIVLPMLCLLGARRNPWLVFKVLFPALKTAAFTASRDRCNTVVNVLGDCVGVAMVNQLSLKELSEMEEEQNQGRTRLANDAGDEHYHSSSSLDSFHSVEETFTV
ncbi:excitatory amino acid transporter 3-like isoform X1 [Sander lucioperca]|uniref:Amino acid transporter n=1 Tax=Sander lucioperca TaxID=283035 RepID=A0A8C9XHM4_SANLU|nr:excitatory amino acid transporter 3-like isoform X1 [Sander lucioperca]